MMRREHAMHVPDTLQATVRYSVGPCMINRVLSNWNGHFSQSCRISRKGPCHTETPVQKDVVANTTFYV